MERDGLPLGSSGPLTRGGGGGLTCRRWTWGCISAIQAAWQSKTSKTHTSRTLKVGAGGTSLCLRRWSHSSVCVGSEHLGMWWEAGKGGGGSQRGVQDEGQRASFIELGPSAEVPPQLVHTVSPKDRCPGPSSPLHPPVTTPSPPLLGHREMCIPPGADPCGHVRQG